MTPSRFQRLKGQVLKISQQSSEVINVVYFTIIKLYIILQYFLLCYHSVGSSSGYPRRAIVSSSPFRVTVAL